MLFRRFVAALMLALTATLSGTPLQAQRSEPIVLCTYKLVYLEYTDEYELEVWELVGCQVIGQTAS